jgi:hypothetical protein
MDEDQAKERGSREVVVVDLNRSERKRKKTAGDEKGAKKATKIADAKKPEKATEHKKPEKAADVTQKKPAKIT